jgi:hypothetical protein
MCSNERGKAAHNPLMDTLVPLLLGSGVIVFAILAIRAGYNS